MAATLDTELRMLLVRKKLQDSNPSEPGPDVDPNKILYIALKYNGEIDALRNAGFVVGEDDGSIAFGATDLAGLERLAAHPAVEIIQKQNLPDLQLNDSVPDIKANQVWSRSSNVFTGYTGLGVVVGIIDTGINYKHLVFQKQPAPSSVNVIGDTRILKIWDQTLVAGAGEAAPGPITDPAIAITATPLGYGVEYNEDQINMALENENPALPVRHEDKDGHGTHVAGIAAGNGSQNGGCHGGYTYIGVAPHADLIIVRLWGLTDGDRGEKQDPPANPPLPPPSTTNLSLDAMRYIMNEAKKLGKPAVINCSFGIFSEFMDGNSLQCARFDQLLQNNSTGRAIVFAAGNDADANFHANPTIPASGQPVFTLKFQIHPDDKKTRTLAIVYNGSNLEAQVISPDGGASGTVAWVTLNNQGSSTTANGANSNVTVDNAANKIGISLAPPANGTNHAGTWKIEIRNTNTTPTPIDAFCLKGSSHDAKSPRFLNNTTVRTTLCEQASCREVITVGSYPVGGALSKFSGRGPTLNNPPRAKPEICAPGENISSAGIPGDRDCKCCCDCCEDFYVTKQGTSMAAPHITGLVALMLHRNPNLTHTEIKTILQARAGAKPAGSSADEDLGWGSGKADALNTVINGVTQVNPPVAVAMVAPEMASAATPGLLERFRATPFGEQYFQLAHQFFQEVLHLVNTNKRVATAWHRVKGPMWVRLAIKSFYNPALPIPQRVGGMGLLESANQFLQRLREFASADLLQGLQGIEPHLSGIEEGMSLSDMMLWMGNRPLHPYPANNAISEPVKAYSYV